MVVSVEVTRDGLLRTRGARVNLAFTTQGSGSPVVLLHGTSASHAVWQAVADVLAPRAQVICLDQRGHGRSDKPVSGYTAADFAEDVVTVLDALGIERAVVGGHSLGGRNAWVTAALHPERVSAALVVDYTPYVETHVLDELQLRVAGGFRAFASLAEVETYLHERYPLLPAEAVARRGAWGYRQDSEGNWRPLADPHAMTALIDGFRNGCEAEFAAVSVPMTHIRGARSKIVSEASWQTARAARSEDRWIISEDADHYVPEENPTLIADELGRFL